MIRTSIFTIAVLNLIACSSMEQAPLIYTSKQVVGIDISAPTTEASGVTVNVGFKNVDAAYVPVAVTNRIPEKWSPKKEMEKLPEIKDVYATYGRGDQLAGGTDSETKKLQAERVQKLGTALAELQRAEQDLKVQAQRRDYWSSASAALTQYQTALNQYQQAKLPPAQEAAAASTNVTDVNLSEVKEATIKQLDGFFQALQVNAKDVPTQSNFDTKKLKDIIEQGLSTTTTAAQQAQDRITQASSSVNAAQELLAKSLFVTQRDAMSVFGSFDSNTKTDPNEVGISFGKLFSTGVAAQNLSKAIDNATLRVSCTKGFSDISDQPRREQLIKECVGKPDN